MDERSESTQNNEMPKYSGEDAKLMLTRSERLGAGAGANLCELRVGPQGTRR